MKTAIRSDEELAAQVQRVLAHEPSQSLAAVQVDAVDGLVRLFGVCPTLAEVRRASELVSQAPGVRAVENLLAVESAHPLADAELQEQASAAAARVEPRLEVEVEDGVVVLRGELENPDRMDAVVHAVERVPGLKELHTEVTFTTVAAAEGELRPAVEQAIRSAYPVVKAIRIASVRNGRVTLEGRVSSSEQRDRVLDAVRRVPGVERVETHIRIRPNKPEEYQGRHRSGGEW